MSKKNLTRWNAVAKKAALQFAKDLGVKKNKADSDSLFLYYCIIDLVAALALLSEAETKNGLGQLYEEARDIINGMKRGEF